VRPDTSAAEAVKVAERSRQLVSETPLVVELPEGGERQLWVTASLGVAALDDKIHTPAHRKRAYGALTLDGAR